MKKGSLGWLLPLALAACGGPSSPLQQAGRLEEWKSFPLDSLTELKEPGGFEYDPEVSSDGRGSLRLQAAGKVTVPLFEVTDVDFDNTFLNYQARLRSENLQGQAYLEMLVRLPGRGEFFSRSIERPLTGTQDWTTISTPFYVAPEQRPDRVLLNLVVDGSGRVWIDDIRLQRQALPRPESPPGTQP